MSLTTRQATSELEQTFTKALIETIQLVNSTPRDQRGVWYYDDYHAYCQEHKISFKEDLRTGFANPEYWKKTGRCTFELKDGKKPSEAIKAFMSGFTIADCGNIITVAKYAALLKVLGEEKFNLLFSTSCASLIISQNLYERTAPTSSFFFDVLNNDTASPGEIGSRPVVAGDMCHLRGVFFYRNKHPAGTSSGFNVVCVGKNEAKEDLFIGFGPNTFIKPLTEREFQEVFIRYYNLDRSTFDMELLRGASLRFEEKLSFPEDAPCVDGFLPGSVVRPDFKKINAYVLADQNIVVRKFYSELKDEGELRTSKEKSVSEDKGLILQMEMLRSQCSHHTMTNYSDHTMTMCLQLDLDSPSVSKSEFDELNKILGKYPDNVKARLKRALFYRNKAEYKNALDDYDHVYKQYKTHQEASEGVAFCKKILGIVKNKSEGASLASEVHSETVAPSSSAIGSIYSTGFTTFSSTLASRRSVVSSTRSECPTLSSSEV